MENSDKPPRGTRLEGAFHWILALGLFVGVGWLVLGQQRLNSELAKVRSELKNDFSRAEQLMLSNERQAIAMDKTLANGLNKLLESLDQQTTTITKTVADGFNNVPILLDQKTAVMHSDLAKVHSELKNDFSRAEQLMLSNERQAIAMDKNLANGLSELLESLDQQTTTINKSLADGLNRVPISLDQQTAVMHRALGKVIPVLMPPEWVDRLEQLSGITNTPGRWPKDPNEAQGFLDRLSLQIKEMPAWAEDDYLPRLSALRWAAFAFVSLNRPVDDTSLPSILGEIKMLLGGMPESGSADLQRKLDEKSQVLLQAEQQSILANAIQDANRLLEKVAPQTDLFDDIFRIQDILRLNEQDGSQAVEIRDLRVRVQKLIIEQQSKQQAASLAGRWSAVQTLKSGQPAMYATSVNLLLQEVEMARVALALEMVQQSDLDDLGVKLRLVSDELSSTRLKQEEDRQAKALRMYQKWALTQIMSFEERVKTVGSTADQESSWYKKDKGGWSDERYIEVRDSMVNSLLPIDENLLDRAIRERYERASKQGWEKLDGTEHQTFVAEQTALTIKKSLREFFEVKP